MRFQYKRFIFSSTASVTFFAATAQQKATIYFNEKKTFQTIRNFAASDAWSAQFVGNWPDAKRNAVADWLFSMDTLSNGDPKGIGLSMWRYNLGAGSAGQDTASGIKDEWRRAALTVSDNEDEIKKVQAQNWFLQAAKKRGVKDFLAFYNSPPVMFTKNGKAFATKAQTNIDQKDYEAFAKYTVAAFKKIKASTGIAFNYISPVNEPQWDWSDGGQEGCPYNNAEISGIVKAFNASFKENKLSTKILVTESGDLKFLMNAGMKNDKDAQVYDLFNPASGSYVGDLSNISKSIAAHSYFTTSPFEKGIALRNKIRDSIATIKDLEYWQSEYCILGDNAGEINGDKKDLGMTAALYVAKVMYEDLAGGNAAAWQWWTAISAYDYKDGLVYVEKNNTDGNVSDSKMLWAMGNYSRFIRPGMKRIDADIDSKNILLSAYKDFTKGTTVLVFVNESAEETMITSGASSGKKVITYTTDATRNLAKQNTTINELTIPAKSVVTVVTK